MDKLVFYQESYKIKLRYTDYCCITEEILTENIDEHELHAWGKSGIYGQFLIKCLPEISRHQQRVGLLPFA